MLQLAELIMGWNHAMDAVTVVSYSKNDNQGGSEEAVTNSYILSLKYIH